MTDPIAKTSIFTADRSVAFQDIDAAGIVFFARFFEYCHDVFFAFMSERGLPIHEVLARGVWGSPVAHAEADYRIPLRFGDPITIAIRKITIGSSSMKLDYEVLNAKSKTVAIVNMVHVFIDRTAMRPCPAPDEVRVALKDFATFEAAT